MAVMRQTPSAPFMDVIIRYLSHSSGSRPAMFEVPFPVTPSINSGRAGMCRKISLCVATLVGVEQPGVQVGTVAEWITLMNLLHAMMSP